jgi:hypothetical protein
MPNRTLAARPQPASRHSQIRSKSSGSDRAVIGPWDVHHGRPNSAIPPTAAPVAASVVHGCGFRDEFISRHATSVDQAETWVEWHLERSGVEGDRIPAAQHKPRRCGD